MSKEATQPQTSPKGATKPQAKHADRTILCSSSQEHSRMYLAEKSYFVISND